jgi:PAS domain S-box-containing protein
MQRIEEELLWIKELLRQHPHGMTITEIAAELKKNKHSVGRYLDILHASGHVDLRTFGMAKVYTLSSRVPLSALLSYTTDLVILVDSNLRVLQINDPFLTLLKLDKDAVLFKEIRYIPAPDPAILSLLETITEHVRLGRDLDEIELLTDPVMHFHLRVVPTVFEDGGAGTTAILEDNTSLHSALDEIKKSRVFFEDMIANMSDGLMVTEVNKSGKELLFINARLTEITGYTKEELIHMEPGQIAERKEKKRFSCKFKAMRENPSSIQDISFWAVKKDGESRYLNVRMSSNVYGEKTRYYILIADMTEKRRREELQDLQWNIMRRVVDQQPHPICCYRSDNTIFLVNKPFCELFNCIYDNEMTGKKLEDVLPEDLFQAYVIGDNDLINEDIYKKSQIPIFCHDGVKRDVQLEKSAVFVGDGDEKYVFSILLSDCKEKKKDK